MKKVKLTMAALAATALLSGCGAAGSSLMGGMLGGNVAQGSTTASTTTTSTTSTTSATTTAGESGGLASLIGNVLGAVLGASNTLTEADLVGTWNFQSVDCVFESENFLMKAGGEVAAAQIETKLNETFSKFGVVPGACSFTFNNDNTYSAQVSALPMNGQYALDAANKKLTMTYLAGLGTMTPNIVKTGNKISLLYEADKLLAIAQKLAAMSGNTSLQTLADLASQYDGLMIGLELQK
ncbi:MAG: DUF4923 family protein [Bacteroidaceae bacterium]|nr:DUF4923 family protein [Bacteroidaceae bacterium]